MLKEMLTEYAKCSPFHDFLLKHGAFMGGCEPSKPQQEMNQCFKNSTHEAMVTDGQYFEGVVCKPGIPILIHHAWIVEPSGRVLDLTLRDCGTAEYCGIHIDMPTLLERTVDQGYYGIFSDGMMYSNEFIKERWGYDMLAFKSPFDLLVFDESGDIDPKDWKE